MKPLDLKPFASTQEAYDAGLADGMRRLADEMGWSDVVELSEESDRRHDMLSAERRAHDNCRAENARLRAALEPTEENVYAIQDAMDRPVSMADARATLAAIRRRAGLEKVK